MYKSEEIEKLIKFIVRVSSSFNLPSLMKQATRDRVREPADNKYLLNASTTRDFVLLGVRCGIGMLLIDLRHMIIKYLDSVCIEDPSKSTIGTTLTN